MTTVQDINETSASTRNSLIDMKLEVIVIPVSDVDRAKAFYKSMGWREDADFAAGDDFRVVQLTPPGSAEVRPVPKMIELPDPGGVNWSTRKSSLTARSASSRHPRLR